MNRDTTASRVSIGRRSIAKGLLAFAMCALSAMAQAQDIDESADPCQFTFVQEPALVR